MKDCEAEYAKVTIIISSPESNLPPTIQQTSLASSGEEETDVKKKKQMEKLQNYVIMKQSKNVQEERARRQRQDNIGLGVVFTFMVR